MRQEDKKRDKKVEVNGNEASDKHPKKLVYVRKLTSEELLEKFIVLLKADQDKFPAPGHPFIIRAGEQNFRVSIKEITNQSSGPQKSRLIISTPKLFVTQKFKIGDKIVLSKKDEKIYQLRKI